jgi:hypothetical protein
MCIKAKYVHAARGSKKLRALILRSAQHQDLLDPMHIEVRLRNWIAFCFAIAG